MNQPGTFIQEKYIINVLLRHASFIDNIGLMNGKMGIAIFFFHLGKMMKIQVYEDYAEELVDDIYQKIGTTIIPMDFENGLAGVAWGIEHLVHNGFIEADTDEILSDLDDKIFQHLTNSVGLSISVENGLLGYGFYLLSRLRNKDLKKNVDHNFILKRLLIDLINCLYETIEEKEEVLIEPVTFKITWSLPLTLILLSEIRRLNIYNRKIDIILNRLSHITLSRFPMKQANKLFLLTGMQAILKQADLKGWHEHFRLLKDTLDADEILREFPDKNIMVSDGLGGITLIAKLLEDANKESALLQLSSKIAEKIVRSACWKSFEGKDKLNAKNLGILDGLSGIGYSLLGIF
ncbi:lanthionine synthetase LanC family protein [Fulvivirgaceae bacterium BMA12]|uniref:Lanthionine synthetase LanC family protein n=1 Tax=Agaribacillus aureus TaxID=3051825 RepID=A0ABT8LAC0_9BACT|nr:lanthionine synthetase LanC family protein [Fulvivirgaceae bacterium BMA12]